MVRVEIVMVFGMAENMCVEDDTKKSIVIAFEEVNYLEFVE